MAGLSVIIMTIAPMIKTLVGNTPTRSSASMIVMYNIVFLLMAVIGVAGSFGSGGSSPVATFQAPRTAFWATTALSAPMAPA